MNKYLLLFFVCLLLLSSGAEAHKLPSPSKVKKIMVQVNDYWQSHHLQHGKAFWDNAAYHTGNMSVYQATGIERYKAYSMAWAERNQWMGARSENPQTWRYQYGETDEYVLFGDWQTCFQTYIDLYNLSGQTDQRMIKRAIEVMEYQMNTDTVDYWWWADGLYMVMPVMTKLYKVTRNKTYLDKLHTYFNYARNLMCDEETGLFFRDAKYIYPKHKTANHLKDFWARGNGWVFAAMAKVLADLPPDHEYRSLYEETFKTMALTLKANQMPEGYWTRSILDSDQAPGPETSGTAFFAYGLFWGINNGYLPAKDYLQTALNAWEYLANTAISKDGRVGYVQPIGERAIPGQVVDENSTANFGVGAVLLAASELYSMTRKKR